MTVKTFAKINLALSVLGKSGRHHRIRTIFQQIDLHDTLTFEKIPAPKIIFTCNNSKIPQKNNTVLQAAKILKNVAQHGARRTPHNIYGLKIHLQKNIPMAAGLGGGSSNAAATLLALNKLWRLNLSRKRLAALGAKIGMDVPFFLQSRSYTALGTRFGEKIKPLPALPSRNLLIIMNSSKKSTKEAYKKIALAPHSINRRQTSQLVAALKAKKHKGITSFFHNDFDAISDAKTAKLKKMLLRTGAISVHTAGSGPAIYALYNNRRERQRVFIKLKDHVAFLWQGATLYS